MSDSRAGAFVRRHGQLVQVELDALPPDVLRSLYAEAVERLWDVVSAYAYEDVLEQEHEERVELERLAEDAA